MAARGVDQIQVAEVLTFFEPADWVTEAVNIAFQDVPCYRIVHICYGQQEGQPGVTELRGPKLFPWVWEFAADQIQYEMASHDFDDSDIRAIRTMPANKHFGVGVIKGKDLRVEAPEWIAAGIRKVLAVLPPENVCISTDCTLSGLHRIVAKRKLKALVEGTNLVRAEVGARLVTA